MEARFCSVRQTRRFQIIKPSAIMPFTRKVPNRTSNNRFGPRKAPNAPTNFQSPAPRLRIATKGRRSSNPNPAPNSADLHPGQRKMMEFARIPITSPGTVSQLGIRRERQSVHPAIRENSAASTQIFIMFPAVILGEKWPKWARNWLLAYSR